MSSQTPTVALHWIMILVFGVQALGGDAVFFYGDQCEHWISPVTSGRRIILQMEAPPHLDRTVFATSV